MKRFSRSACLQHLTLNTGHDRSSPRSEVADDVIDSLTPFVALGGGVLAHTGWKLQMVHGPADGSCCFNLTRGEDWIATCHLAWTAEGAEALWPIAAERARQMGGPVVGGSPCRLPWLSVVLMPQAMLASPITLFETGDLARCVAWTALELLADRRKAGINRVRPRRTARKARRNMLFPGRRGHTIH